MTLCTKRVLSAALAMSVLAPAMAWAQLGKDVSGSAAMETMGGPAISANGTATVQRGPTQLRLSIQILAKGKTLEDALGKLKERREAATAQLESLKADKKSIVFGSPNLSNAASARKQQIEAMVMEQMRTRGKKMPKGLQAPQTVTVSATLTAEWPLKPESPEKLLVFSQGIQEKIKAADLAGAKEVEKLSPEEQEFEEEAAQVANQFGQQEQQPGQPQFVFVAVLSKEDREKLMAEAFNNAKKEAAELAKAAGVELGPLMGLSGHCGGQGSFGGGQEGDFRFGRMQYPASFAIPQAGEDPNAKQDEAVGTDPGELKFAGSVTVLFQHQPGK